jgi:hypothetical protein
MSVSQAWPVFCAQAESGSLSMAQQPDGSVRTGCDPMIHVRLRVQTTKSPVTFHRGTAANPFFAWCSDGMIIYGQVMDM